MGSGAVAKLEIPVGFRFFKESIIRHATAQGMDPVLCAAMCWKESDFKASAFKFEPDFWNRYLKGNPIYAHLNPLRVSSSYGLMQVMYCRLLEDKVADNDIWPPEDLFEPEKNLEIGVAFFLELLAWANKRVIPETVPVKDPFIRTMVALASYNGGRGGNDPAKNWPLRNGRYAADVIERYAVIRKVM